MERWIAMQLVTRVPGPPLSQFVAYLWWMRDIPAHTTERIVPSGTLEVVVNLQDDEIGIYQADATQRQRYSGTVVSGAYQRYFTTDTRVHASIVGVHFKPGGAGPVLGIPPGSAGVDKLRRAGTRFRNDVETGPGGTQIQIEDPDGNPIEIHQPPT